MWHLTMMDCLSTVNISAKYISSWLLQCTFWEHMHLLLHLRTMQLRHFVVAKGLNWTKDNIRIYIICMLLSSGQCLQAWTLLLRPTLSKRSYTLKAKNYKKLKTNVTRWGWIFISLLILLIHVLFLFFMTNNSFLYSNSWAGLYTTTTPEWMENCCFCIFSKFDSIIVFILFVLYYCYFYKPTWSCCVCNITTFFFKYMIGCSILSSLIRSYGWWILLTHLNHRRIWDMKCNTNDRHFNCSLLTNRKVALGLVIVLFFLGDSDGAGDLQVPA